jgi:hypothetical protein
MHWACYSNQTRPGGNPDPPQSGLSGRAGATHEQLADDFTLQGHQSGSL